MVLAWNPRCSKRLINVTSRLRQKCERYCWAFPGKGENLQAGELQIGSTNMHFSDDDGYRLAICDDLDIIRFIELILIILLNVVLLVFIAANRKLRGNKANKFFLNLQLVHITISLSGIVSMFLHSKPTYMEIVLNNGFLLEMFFSLFVTTCDRYAQIVYPYVYQRFTTKRTLQIIILSWVLPLTFIIIAFNVQINQLHLTVITTCTIAIAITTLIMSNGKLYIVAKRAGMTIIKNKNTRVLKSTYVCLSLVSSFVVLWFPYLLHNFLVFAGKYKANNNAPFTRIVVQIALLNSLLDPIFFVLFRRDVKREFRKLGRRYLHMRQFTKEHRISMQQQDRRSKIEIEQSDSNSTRTQTESVSLTQGLL